MTTVGQPVPPGSLPTSLSLAFRARPDASGSAQIMVNAVVFDVGGQPRALPLAGTASVTIAP